MPLPSPLGSFHADRMEIRRLRTERAELIEELELAAEQGRLVGLQADRYRQALERIAATTPAAELGKPWKHWRLQAQEALNA